MTGNFKGVTLKGYYNGVEWFFFWWGGGGYLTVCSYVIIINAYC